MDKLVFILSISFGSLGAGYLARRILLAAGLAEPRGLQRTAAALKMIALIALYPPPVLNGFWKMPLDYPGLAVYPWLGLLYFLTGGLAAVLAARLYRLAPERAASLFTCSMFANIGAFASTAALVLYGQSGFLVVQLLSFFEAFVYFTIGFPLSAAIARGRPREFRFSPATLWENRMSLLPVTAILAGLTLNLAGAARPALLEELSPVMVLSLSALLGLAIGLTLRPGRLSAYGRELGLLGAIKFAVIPVVVIAAGAAAAAAGWIDAGGFRVVIFFGFLPSGFISLIPPSLYGFDLDLANSGWLVTTLAMLAVFPVLFFVMG